MIGINVNIISESGILPEYETEGSSGMDLRACIPKRMILGIGECKLIPTGLRMAIPLGYEMQIRPRSGLAFKHGVTVLNSPGTIDADYRGTIGVLLINFSNKLFEINNGDRIAQGVFAEVIKVDYTIVNSLKDTIRGEGGFGHSGVK